MLTPPVIIVKSLIDLRPTSRNFTTILSAPHGARDQGSQPSTAGTPEGIRVSIEVHRPCRGEDKPSIRLLDSHQEGTCPRGQFGHKSFLLIVLRQDDAMAHPLCGTCVGTDLRVCPNCPRLATSTQPSARTRHWWSQTGGKFPRQNRFIRSSPHRPFGGVPGCRPPGRAGHISCKRSVHHVPPAAPRWGARPGRGRHGHRPGRCAEEVGRRRVVRKRPRQTHEAGRFAPGLMHFW